MKKSILMFLTCVLLAMIPLVIGCDDTFSGDSNFEGGNSNFSDDDNNGSEQGGMAGDLSDNIKENDGLVDAIVKISEGLEYQLSDDESYYIVTGIGNCTDTDLGIPDEYDGKPVKAIVNYAFYDCNSLTSVALSNGITSIGEYAFYNCNKLNDITIANSVINIGKYAFCDCDSLTRITLTNGVMSIGDEAFAYCRKLTSVTIPDSVTNIGDRAFYYCSGLTSITIGNSVTSIGDDAFYDCSSLTRVNISDIAAWCAISFASKSSNPLRFAEKLYLNGSLVTELVIPDGVTSIEDFAFYYCSSLTNIVIPNSVTSIGNEAFVLCSNLKNMTIGNGVTSIGEDAFSGIRLSNVRISDIAAWCAISFGNTSSNPLCFAKKMYLNGSLTTKLVIPEGVTSIESNTFCYCSAITSVTIPSTVTSIGEDAFYECTELEEIKINAVTMNDLSRDSEIFCNAGKNGDGIKVTIGKDVIKIPAYLFYLSSPSYYRYSPKITSVEFEEGSVCKSIGHSAFEGCSRLTSITVPDGITEIGSLVFYATEYFNNEANWEDEVLYIGKYLIRAKYTISGSYTIEDGTICIADNAFLGCNSLTSIKISDSVTSIGFAAFPSSLESITVAEGNSKYHSEGNCLVETESKTLILGCKNSIIPDDGSVTSIGEWAFSSCSNLTSIMIPNSVTSIGYFAFYDCYSLTTINYTGSEEEWNAIIKNFYWDYKSGSYTIVYNYVGE